MRAEGALDVESGSSRGSSGADPDANSREGRQEFANICELLLTLVGYAVGLGNVWRFPYLTFSHGGGAFLIPYFLALAVLGVPLFVFELGMGSIFRQGAVGIWEKMGLPRFRGVGIAAIVVASLICLYYNVVVAWTIYYIGRILMALPTGVLPWSDTALAFSCPESVLFVNESVAQLPYVLDSRTGLFNKSHAADFWCPASGIPGPSTPLPAGYLELVGVPSRCPARAAAAFWAQQVLQQSSGLTDLGGFHPGMLAAYTVAWLLVYAIIFRGVLSSGKAVYVTALLPYVALFTFLVRALTLPNMQVGLTSFLVPDWSLLLDGMVWVRAASQIFYSLGVGLGCLVALGSYGKKSLNFVSMATNVSLINCGTSFLAGLVVFPVLGFLALELEDVNPCITGSDLTGLSSIGLSGTGLTFIAFPIAITQMAGSFFFALLFFIMLLCLGLGSEFAAVEGIIAVLRDLGLGIGWSRPAFAAAVCCVFYLCGLVFVTRAGLYWVELFDVYSGVLGLFFVTGVECAAFTWSNRKGWAEFVARVRSATGVTLGPLLRILWMFVCPLLLCALFVVGLTTLDLMDARGSKPYPLGTGYLPEWSIGLGWLLAFLPLIAFAAVAAGDWCRTLPCCRR